MQASADPKKNDAIIFIPFSESENNIPLLTNAALWQENCRKAGKPIPEIVIYNPNNQFPGEKDFTNVTIYLLAHGANDPRWVVNANGAEDKIYELPIELIADRLKKMGLTPPVAKKLKSLNLYICEELLDPTISTTKALAINLAHVLGNEYDNLLIQYYAAKVLLPSSTPFDSRVKKRAMQASWHRLFMQILPSNPRLEGIDKQIIDQHFLVRANKFKKNLYVWAALQETPTTIDEKTRGCLQVNAAYDATIDLFCVSLFRVLQDFVRQNISQTDPGISYKK